MKNGDRLGRGLQSLLSGELDLEEEAANRPKGEFFRCNIADIRPNPYQPRKEMDEQALSQLAESIKKRGVLQPLVVREIDGENQYELIAGERRLRAAKLAGLAEVPVLVKKASPEARLEIALIENIQRQNLNPVEEAAAYKRLTDEFKMTQDEVAKKVGKERSTVTNIMRLLQLPEYVQSDVASGRISMGHARVLLGVADEVMLRELRDRVIAQGLSVREIEKIVSSQKNTQGGKNKAAQQNKKAIPETYCKTLAEDVSRTLGTKSKIIQNGTRGKLEIEYYSLEDLERIHRLLTSLQVDKQ
ncbi:MAG: ParB/RepB/Spo0J family partition protein [Desulfobulbaceae bacterium]|nr:ParB/RepB/Spo0J family partition protein [Desulfobulbaceae bacterium]